MESIILGSDGNPAQVDPPKETPESNQILGKEAAKLLRALDNRKVPVILIAFQKGNVVVRSNVAFPPSVDKKKLVKEIIDRQL